jgi:hypothetical protein
MKAETIGTKKHYSWQIGYDSDNTAEYGIGVYLWPSLEFGFRIHKFVIDIELKLDKLWH